jgi:putative membrane protein
MYEDKGCKTMMDNSMIGGCMMGGGMMGWMVLGWLLALVILVALVVAIVWAIGRAGGNFRSINLGPARPVNEALDILKRRYAQGEIDDEQYERMKRQLEER